MAQTSEAAQTNSRVLLIHQYTNDYMKIIQETLSMPLETLMILKAKMQIAVALHMQEELKKNIENVKSRMLVEGKE